MIHVGWSEAEHPLFVGDPDALRRKLDGATGLLGEYWADFRARQVTDPGRRNALIFLPTLITGEGIDEAKDVLKRAWREEETLQAGGGVQFHVWCHAMGRLFRQVVFFDWLAARGAWSPAETEEAADVAIGMALKHVYPVLQSRCRSSNNQVMGMALYCAVAGYVFGRKHGRHPSAQFLMDYGISRLPDIIGLHPGDGYGGEGSTYITCVMTPQTMWLDAFLREATGRSWFETPFQPNGTTLKALMEMEFKATSPGGLMAPWDHYGWTKPIFGSAYAYLARASGDARYLSLIPAFGLWGNTGGLAWGEDDMLWTLLWWPEAFKDFNQRAPEPALFGWLLPRTGAALDDCARRTRLMQVWDQSADTIAGVTRGQVNPNHVMFDYGGEPVFQDGVHAEGSDPWMLSAERVLESLAPAERERWVRYAMSTGNSLKKSVGMVEDGLIAAANAIVVDEEPWYWPGGGRIGTPLHYSTTDGVQVVSADAAAFYQPRHDVRVARRTSIWSREGFGLILDRLEADSPHTWRWQVHLRPDVTLDANGRSAAIRLPSGRRVMLAWDQVAQARSEQEEGFPNTEEKRSCRLDLLQQGRAATFAVLIAPEVARASVCWHAGRVIVEIDGRRHELPVASFTEGCNVQPPLPDVLSLPETEAEFDLQFSELRVLLGAGSSVDDSAAPGGSGLLDAMDRCCAQLHASEPDTQFLMQALETGIWPVQGLAAEILGRLGVSEAAPRLRTMLAREHATAESDMYPGFDAAPPGEDPLAAAKRWRLKAALIVALGRLRDAASVPLLDAIVTDARDFYTVSSVTALALGRIGTDAARPALTKLAQETECNTHTRSLAALAEIRN